MSEEAVEKFKKAKTEKAEIYQQQKLEFERAITNWERKILSS